MDNHKEHLKHLCRLCGSTRTLVDGRQPILKTRYTLAISKGLKIKVDIEDSSIYPPYICQACSKKLVRWYDRSKRRVVKNSLNISPPDYKVHSEECWVCAPLQPNCPVQDLSHILSSAASLAEKNGFHVSRQNEAVICHKTLNGARFISQRLVIFRNRTWTLEVHGRKVVNNQTIWSIPSLLDKQSVEKLFSTIAASTICKGNEGYTSFCRDKSPSPHHPAIFLNNKREIEAYEEDIGISRTIRHSKCELIVDSSKSSSRCTVCSLYRSDIISMASGKNKNNAQSETCITSSRARNDRLTRPQLEKKARGLQQEKKQIKRKLKSMEEKVQDLIEQQGELLDEEMSSSFTTLMKQKDSEVANIYEKNSAPHIFWQQQLAAASKPKTHRRWHPSVIKWCIALHAKSPAAYRMIRGSKCLILPHECTLSDYTQFTTAAPGFNPEMIHRIKKDIGLDKLPDFKKNVSLLFDEMKIKSGLVYSKSSGKLVGFCEIGDVNEEISQYIEKMKNSDDDTDEHEPKLATHVLALMVRGIFSPLREVFVWHPCSGFNSNQLYWVVWQGIMILEYAGFKVRALVADGATPNRKFFRLHKTADDGEVTYYTVNPFDDTRNIYFICDVPHLIKTTRNNWENSKWNNKTRNLHYDHKDISWTHLIELTEDDIGARGFNGVAQLRRLPKITTDHIMLTPSSRMRVRLAAQVLSNSVEKAFDARGKHYTKSTEIFVRMIDRFFDCLNVTRLGQGRRSRKPDLDPYQSPDDRRFKWLQEDFLGFLNGWEMECLGTMNMSIVERRKMCLSRETLEGYRITVNSFVTLAPVLLQLEGVDFLLSEKFCQDPLEEYFSKQRGCVGRNDNPTVPEFARNALSLYVAGSETVRRSARGNCTNVNRDDDDPGHVDAQPLPRRNRRKK